MSTQEQPSIPTGANGFGQWAGLYVSGILLVVFVLAHIVAVHYAGDRCYRALVCTWFSTTYRKLSGRWSVLPN